MDSVRKSELLKIGMIAGLFVLAIVLVLWLGQPSKSKSAERRPDLFREEMYEAVHSSDYPKVARLLKIGASADLDYGERNCLLQIASVRGNLKIATLLLDHGANPTHCSTSLANVLPAAISAGQLEIIDLLIRRGADVKRVDKTDGRTSLHEAALGMVKDYDGILESYYPLTPDDTHSLRKYGSISEINLKMMETILKHSTDTHVRDLYGFLPLHMAAREGNAQVVRLLLKAGADVNAAASAPFETVVNGVSEETLPKWIAEQKDLFPSMLSSFCAEEPKECAGDPQLLKKLKAGKGVGQMLQMPALHFALDNNSVEAVRVLLEEGKADPNQTDGLGCSPLVKAVLHWDKELVRSLLKHGANPLQKSKLGFSALSLARLAAADGMESAREIVSLFGKPPTAE